MTCMSCGESGDGSEGRFAGRAEVSVVPIAVSTSRRSPDMVIIMRRRSVLVRLRDERECAGLFGPIATFLLGLIERLIRRLDQIGGGSVPAGNRTGIASANGGAVTLGVRNAEGLNSLQKRFRHLCRSVCTGTGKDDHEFVTAVPSHEVSWSVDSSRDSGGNLPKAFVARRMAEGIVVGFEPIHVEHDQRQRRQFADAPTPVGVQTGVK